VQKAGAPQICPHCDIPNSDTALQALISSLAPGESSTAKTPSKEDISKLSDKLKGLLGDVDSPQGAVQRGEVCIYTDAE